MATTLQVSSHNPFRAQPTPSPPAATSPISPPPLPPRRHTPTPETTQNTTSDLPATDNDTGLEDELPPAYTPSPDTRQGEATIEYGPLRPYQAPPPNPSSISTSYRPPVRSQARPSPASEFPALFRQLAGLAPISNSTSNSEWSSFPGRRRRLLNPDYTGLSRFNSTSQSTSYLPPPGPPPPPPPPAAPRSDFARDFYAAGAGAPQADVTGTYAPPPGPPPGVPPIPTTSTSNRGENQPTSVPKPGHPLLKDGKLLVYPSGYECQKCEPYFI